MSVNKKLGRRVRRTSRACTSCQRRKIRCNGGRPCLSCMGSQTKCQYLYQPHASDTFFSDNSPLLANGPVSASHMGSNVPAHFQKLLADVASFLDGVNAQHSLTMDTREICSYSGSRSIETEIVGKQSQFLNRFSDPSSNKAEQNLSLYFGLYSSLLYLTPMGISWLIQKLISYSDDRATRETIYLVLKYLDTATSNHEKNQRLRLSSPLKYYAYSKSLVYDEEKIIRVILDEAHRCFAENSLNSDSYIEFSEPSNAFSFSVSLLNQLQITFKNSKINQVSLKGFLEDGDSILCLCTEFFERSFFSHINDVSLLSSLLSLIEHVYWREDNSYLGRLISTTSRRSLDAGLNRWEYYVMKVESAADEQRRSWWNIYWWDKWYASIAGKPPSVPDEMTWCLFPRDLMQLGVENSMDCLSLIQKVQLDPSEPEACVLFCRILLAKIITRVFSVVLYNRDFTDYRLFTAAAAKYLPGTMEQLKAEFNTICDIFTAFETKISPFFRSNLKKESFFEVYIQSCFVVVTSFQSMESLMLRIQNLSQMDRKLDLFKSLTHCEEQISNYCADILLSILKTNDKFQVIKSSWAIFTTIIILTTFLVKTPRDNALYRLSLICGVVSRFTELVNCADEGSSSWTRLMQGTVLSLILTRVCCQSIMSTQKISKDDLKNELLNYGSSCAEIFESVLDINCLWYKELLCNKEQSHYCEVILRNIEKKIDDFARNKSTDPKGNSVDKNGNDDDAYSGEITGQGISIESLETFLECDASLDFLTTFWNDAPGNIFDLGDRQFGSRK